MDVIKQHGAAISTGIYIISKGAVVFLCSRGMQNTSYFKLNYLSTDIKTRIVVVTNVQLYKSRGRYNKFHTPPC